jgi:hypothetical protein
MTDTRESKARSTRTSYSPQHRTALVLTGTGTSGAYHAGVLRALHEAGVKIDIIGANGMGVVGALFAAVDGTQKLWDDRGFWRSSEVRAFYPWHQMHRLAVYALGLSIVIVFVPISAMAIGLIVYPIDFVLKMIGLSGAGGLVGSYLRLAESAFAPVGLPTWIPRLVVLVLGLVGIVALFNAWMSASARKERGPLWWRLVRPPLSSSEAVNHCWRVMWDLLRGAAQLKQPAPLELGRRYLELVAENLGQPGFRELVISVHDLDAHRDLIFALVGESRRPGLVRRTTSDAAEERRAEVFDLAGVAREYLPAILAGALAVPLACEPSEVRFAADAYWRGEVHRLCDRPASVARLLEELIHLNAQQIVVVSSAPDVRAPHTLSPPRLDGRGRVGEYLQSSEAAAVRDSTRLVEGKTVQLFAVRPDHNPIGPFDFGGGFDVRSDRPLLLDELMARGYEDAYHQFIEPVVGASGEL